MAMRRVAGLTLLCVGAWAVDIIEDSGDELIKRIGRDLGCYSCVTSMNRFKFEITRNIDTKASDEEKEAMYAARWEKSHPCADKFVDEKMVVASKVLFGNHLYMSYSSAWERKGTAIVMS